MTRLMRRAAIALALVLASGSMCLLSATGAAADGDTRCAVPESLTFVDTPLPQVTKKLQARLPVHVVVLGTRSSMPTTKGLPRPSAPGLHAALETRMPGLLLQLDNLSEQTHPATNQTHNQ